MRKVTLMLVVFGMCLVLSACTAATQAASTGTPEPALSETATLEPVPTATPTPEPSGTPIKTTPPDELPMSQEPEESEEPAQTEDNEEPEESLRPAEDNEEPEQSEEPDLQLPGKGTIVVSDADMLERDIIPQMCEVFGLTEEQVKSVLATAEGRLVSGDAPGFRRMEGVIVPGRYEVNGETLEQYVDIWIQKAEQRYDAVMESVSSPNGLSAAERLTLASIVEAECLGDEFEEQAAAVLLNRLNNDSKLRCCVTVEYALGYQRPYTTSEDLKVESDYSTYKVKGLPPGPICAVDDESLAAASGQSVDKSLYYFFYNYADNTMEFFADYDAFIFCGLRRL